jgi:CRP-like cAMP-binding protein
MAVELRFKDDVILGKTDLASCCYFILDGNVSCRDLPNALSDLHLHAGEFLSQNALILAQPCPANVVVTSEKATLLTLHRDAIRQAGLTRADLKESLKFFAISQKSKKGNRSAKKK